MPPDPSLLDKLKEAWSALTNIAGNIVSFFSGIGDAVSSIVNVGQGIFGGLVSIGSMLWDAIKSLADKMVEAFERMRDGFVLTAREIAGHLGNALRTVWGWISSGITTLASGVYRGLQWLWNGLKYIAQALLNAVASVVNWIVNAIRNAWRKMVEGYNAVASTINNWFTEWVKGLRAKIKQMITADVAIVLTWKSMENVTKNPTPKTIAGAVLATVASPLLGAIAAEMLTPLIPAVSTPQLKVLPTFDDLGAVPEITISGVTVPYPSEPTAPSEPGPITLPSLYTAEYSKDYEIGAEHEYGLLVVEVQTTEASIDAEHEAELPSTGTVVVS